MAVRTCTVSCEDSDGHQHSMEVTAGRSMKPSHRRLLHSRAMNGSARLGEDTRSRCVSSSRPSSTAFAFWSLRSGSAQTANHRQRWCSSRGSARYSVVNNVHSVRISDCQKLKSSATRTFRAFANRSSVLERWRVDALFHQAEETHRDALCTALFRRNGWPISKRQSECANRELTSGH